MKGKCDAASSGKNELSENYGVLYSMLIVKCI
jgi:hypothetical protein